MNYKDLIYFFAANMEDVEQIGNAASEQYSISLIVCR